jgi:hypothetical protein
MKWQAGCDIQCRKLVAHYGLLTDQLASVELIMKTDERSWSSEAIISESCISFHGIFLTAFLKGGSTLNIPVIQVKGAKNL